MEILSNSDTPVVDFLILADHVESVHGKLYMMGGAWENIGVGDFGTPVPLSMAVGVQVPWHGTNRQHMLSIDVQTVDAEELANIDAPVMVGRPPHLEEGASQRQVFALNMPVQLPGPGTYVIVASVNGLEAKRVTFRAMGTAPMFAPQE